MYKYVERTHLFALTEHYKNHAYKDIKGLQDLLKRNSDPTVQNIEFNKELERTIKVLNDMNDELKKIINAYGKDRNAGVVITQTSTH